MSKFFICALAIDSFKYVTPASVLASLTLGIVFLWLLQRAYDIRNT